MFPEVGHLALILALCLATAQTILGWVGATRGAGEWMAAARTAALAQFAFLLIAFGLLAHAFATNDFSIAYVAHNSNSALPVQYRIAAVWGAHEGSLLLWVTELGIWTAAVCVASASMPKAFVARVIAVLGVVSAGFLAFLLVTSNPFGRLFPIPEEGRDLNPLLQDLGLVLHPPILYAGYVGSSVAFAFAVAALAGGRVDAAWARWSRPWTAIAWMFLTVGIALGSWWAYYELGWGGWWFWDPVENASFMPWLAGTALLHSAAVTDKRGLFRGWTILLAILAFALSLLGTFLVRSGVLTSVHAFAADPARGVFVLALLGVIVGGALSLYAARSHVFANAPQARFAPMSRETLLLGNNVILVVATAAVLLGTVYPLIVDAFDLGKISVGAPYFNSVFVPLMLLLAALLPVGSMVRWKRDTAARTFTALRGAGVAAAIAAVACAFVIGGSRGLQCAIGAVFAVWIVGGTVTSLRSQWRSEGSVTHRFAGLSRATLGMALAHIGLAVTMAGVAVTSALTDETVRRMSPGDTLELAGYALRFDRLREVPGPNYRALEADITVLRDGATVASLHPQRRAYMVRSMGMTEAAIDPGLFRDLYVAFGEQFEGGAISLRVSVKPLVRWIWLGALVMAAGGLLAATDRRYRIASRRAVRSGERVRRGALRTKPS